MESNIDDVGFVSKLIDFMVAEYRVDQQRVYATGLSNGAQMCYRLVCELSDKLAAVAPLGAQGVFRECKPSRKVPILHIHGTEDRCARYEGGECGGCFQDFFTSIGYPMERKTWPCKSVEESIKEWAVRYGCATTTKVTYNKGPVTHHTSQDCPQGIEVTLCSVEGSGHTWPGGSYALKACNTRPDGIVCKKWKEIVGPIISDVSANELMWEFFKKFRLPE
jgi:polyhydroxybutyrate depolymerase